MSAVRHKRMGFHNDDNAACNKNMGHRSDGGDIGQERMGYCSVERVA